eukprot:COSAG01_NODE_29144_length_644_cov_1.319266_1_plen_88_part_10
MLSMSGLFTSFCSLFLLDLSRLDQPFEKPDGTKLVVSGTMQALDLNLADDFHYWLQGIVYGMACGAVWVVFERQRGCVKGKMVSDELA